MKELNAKPFLVRKPQQLEKPFTLNIARTTAVNAVYKTRCCVSFRVKRFTGHKKIFTVCSSNIQIKANACPQDPVMVVPPAPLPIFYPRSCSLSSLSTGQFNKSCAQPHHSSSMCCAQTNSSAGLVSRRCVHHATTPWQRPRKGYIFFMYVCYTSQESIDN